MSKNTFLTLVFSLFAALLAAQITPISRGESLARVGCAACHAYPEPQLLDKKSWQNHILPRMGFMAGVLPEDSVGVNFIEPEVRDFFLKNPLLHRSAPLFSKKEWGAVCDFYLKMSPEKLPEPALPTSFDTLKNFKIRVPSYFFSPPGTTLVDLENGALTLGDAQQKRIFRFDKNLEIQQQSVVPEGVVSRFALSEGEILTCMGLFSPTDRPTGQVWFFPKNEKSPPVLLLDSLRRPVHSSVADLDGDGLFDLVVSEFGKWQGSLNWWKNRGDGTFEKRPLLAQPGALRSVVRDLDGDGRLDILALFGQGKEGVFAFFNRKNEQFDLEPLLDFPPSFGSVSFDLLDFDSDGDLDILHVAGDNADFPPITKPYQGIRIFENRGKNEFREAVFLALPGAYGAIPADFDGDGDVDIAAISFFPDFKKMPNAGFVFFEKLGNGEFRPQILPTLKNLGRWILMDAADFDGDGDLDLCLGSLAFEVPDAPDFLEKWVAGGVPFLILENLGR